MSIKKIVPIFSSLLIAIVTICLCSGCSSFGSSSSSFIEEKSKDEVIDDPNAQSKGEKHEIKVGQGIKFDNGLTATVSSMTVDPTGSLQKGPITKCLITVTNNGTSNIKVTRNEWSAIDTNGVIVDSLSYYPNSSSDTSLISDYNGLDLVPGGTRTGMIAFNGSISKVVFKPTLITSEASWVQ